MPAPATSPSPAIHCPYTRQIATGKLKPHPNNPNTHPPEQLRVYAKILAHAGWRRPITVSLGSGYIIRGHGAWEVARAAGWKKVPVEYQDYPDADAELADMLADNQLARYATDDRDALEAVVAELNAQNFDLELAGLLAKDKGPEETPPSAGPPQLQILIPCQTEAQQLQLLRQLTSQGLTVRAQIA